MDTPPSFVDGDCGDMNASLWGELQSFIDLSMIYAKLPLAPFFCLRQVCKEWNHLASNRQFLEQNFKPPIPSNPYFVITRRRGKHFLLTSEGSSWNCVPLPQVQCEVSGLLFEYSNSNRVFDLHTCVFHTLPPLPLTRRDGECDFNKYIRLIGMTVDTSSIPYKFRVIVSSGFSGTKVYDSNSGAWTYSPSDPTSSGYGTSCVQYNKSLYVRVGSNYDCSFETYDLERNEWNFHRLQLYSYVYSSCDIGVWQDRWYVFAKHNSVLQVWECKYEPNLNKPWNLFDSASKDLFDWIKDPKTSFLKSKFCGEHVLEYKDTTDMKRALLYNLDHKTWDKIEL